MPNPLFDFITVGKAQDRRHLGFLKSSDMVPLLRYDFVNAGDAGRLPSVFVGFSGRDPFNSVRLRQILETPTVHLFLSLYPPSLF
jgi:hypothetical protein